jgi:hypothetical protein
MNFLLPPDGRFGLSEIISLGITKRSNLPRNLTSTRRNDDAGSHSLARFICIGKEGRGF